jgi:hypothetical protein
MHWSKILSFLRAAITKPEWWSAAAGMIGVLVAVMAFYAAWRAARAAGAAYRTQVLQLDEMKSQTDRMNEQVTEMGMQRFTENWRGVSIWLTEEPNRLAAKICYVNTTGHPVYNVYLEITDISDRFVAISSLEPTLAPKEIHKAGEFFKDELRMIGDLRRPGICFQFDTCDGVRYIRDHSGSLVSTGGNPLYRLPHKMWLPEWQRA